MEICESVIFKGFLPLMLLLGYARKTLIKIFFQFFTEGINGFVK